MKQQLNQCDTTTPEGREELSRLLGEVLLGNPRVNHDEDISGVCRKCGEHIILKDGGRRPVECIAKSIPLDWPNAMKFRDKMVKEYGNEAFHQAIWEVCCELSEHGQNTAYSYWLATNAKPEHYLLAAAYCKIGGE